MKREKQKLIKKNLFFTAPHQTTFSNIKPFLKHYKNSYNYFFVCECNFYVENSKVCETLPKELEYDIYCLPNTFKFKRYYNPSFVHRIFIKVYVKIILKRYLQR